MMGPRLAKQALGFASHTACASHQLRPVLVNASTIGTFVPKPAYLEAKLVHRMSVQTQIDGAPTQVSFKVFLHKKIRIE